MRENEEDEVTHVITWKCLALYDDFTLLFGWSIELCHEKVQVRSQSLHHCNLAPLCTHDGGNPMSCFIVYIQPRW